ncbi:hypothetical protein DE146DRAFT_216090 [Phaeosphaeria sp. MPI-PUGE-AT-0046c]|nr:hypothetical protein DE146DRAFT_216090 [Phaeosphaeria sp. MPI-PUGE-AT-0046c]
MSAQFMNMLANMAPRSNSRSLEDLRDSTDALKGMDAMELRGWASKNPMVPSRDMTDPLGQALLSFLHGNDHALKDYASTQKDLRGEEKLAQELYTTRWGPTRIGIYNVLLIFMTTNPDSKARLLNLTRYLIEEIKVPTDASDVTGASALYWSNSTKPHTQPALAQLLFDAGSSVNHRNRFGNTCGSEIAQVDFSGDTSVNVAMLSWYVEHGGDVDGKDNDGMNVRMLVEMMTKRVPAMGEVLKRGRRERKEGECENCGRKPGGDRVFANCSRCKKVRYCAQECQRVDWKAHKKICVAA